MSVPQIWGRGIDIERVNIVVNYDMPDSSDTYLHRVGRVRCHLTNAKNSRCALFLVTMSCLYCD